MVGLCWNVSRYIVGVWYVVTRSTHQREAADVAGGGEVGDARLAAGADVRDL